MILHINTASLRRLETSKRLNFGKGGQGNDAVVINVQKLRGVQQRQLLTPSDGQPGTMNMFRFTYTKPNRDSGFDNGVVIHEFRTRSL
ncbi:hypothetical protein BASA83_001382 [Batrachochytrium salamandrivorans]|nr:hypothetical protein BASA83_001382 [Batrachochytrium salamandrivorans]